MRGVEPELSPDSGESVRHLDAGVGGVVERAQAHGGRVLGGRRSRRVQLAAWRRRRCTSARPTAPPIVWPYDAGPDVAAPRHRRVATTSAWYISGSGSRHTHRHEPRRASARPRRGSTASRPTNPPGLSQAMAKPEAGLRAGRRCCRCRGRSRGSPSPSAGWQAPSTRRDATRMPRPASTSGRTRGRPARWARTARSRARRGR